MNLSNVNKELTKELRVALGYKSISQYVDKIKINDSKELIEIYNGKLTRLPDRNLLRKIADSSEGRVTWQRLYDICNYSDEDPEENMDWVKFIPVRGKMYWVDLGVGECGIQGLVRPVFVVSNYKNNENSPSVQIIPLTTKVKRNLPTHVHLDINDGVLEKCIASCEQITIISKRRFFYDGYPKYIGELSQNKIKEIQSALEIQLGFKSIMFNEGKAHEMIKHIMELKRVQKLRNNKTLVDMVGDKIKEYEDYCLQYYKDSKEVYNEYKRLQSERSVFAN